MKIKVDNKLAYQVATDVYHAVKVALCKNDGISMVAANRFDAAFNSLKKGEGAPGDSPLCPYRNQHFKAKDAEKAVIVAFGLSWREYESREAK